MHVWLVGPGVDMRTMVVEGDGMTAVAARLRSPPTIIPGSSG